MVQLTSPLADAFRLQAQIHAAAIAVSHGPARITYRDLELSASHMATRLREAGVSPGDRVAISLDRSIGFVIAQLGILITGAVCVPLDPKLPELRRRQLLDDTDACVVIGGHAAPPEPDSARIWLDISDPGSDPVPQGRKSLADAGQSPQDTAFILYTSGSTGAPKGVCIRHASVIHLVCDTDYVEFRAHDVVMHGAHISFDAMLFEVWGALLHGGCIEVVDKETLLRPDALGTLLDSRDVSVAFLTTSLFNITALTCPHIFGRLRHLVVGGEAANAECMRRVLQSGSPPSRLINGYGPTEATTFTTWFLVQSVPPDARTLPIGHPIRRAVVHLLDSELQPVAPGATGEIHIGGVGIASGYWKRPELTAERFLPDHLHPEGRGLLYRTGDLARRGQDGVIEFLGRKDHQVKIRGHRIEVGEIETVLHQHPAVLECAVVADVDGGIARRLVGFVVPRACPPPVEKSAALDQPSLSEWLRQRLPDYLVPARLVFRPSLPRTSTGKIDRLGLESELVMHHGVGSQDAPAENGSVASPTEGILLSIWRELLGTREIDSTASFFELGGDSLMAVQMFLMVRQRLGVAVPLDRWLQSPSVMTLVRELDPLLHTAPPSGSSLMPTTPDVPQILLIGWLLNLSSNEVGGLPCFVLPFPESGYSPETCTVEHLADGCLAAMNSIRSQGPRILVGYSLGGLVAIEMARRMESVGTPPAEVWLIDSLPAGALHRLGPFVGRLAGALGVRSFHRQLLISRAIHSLAEVGAPLFQGRFREWMHRSRQEINRLRSRRNRSKAATNPVAASPESHHPHVWANNSYRPQSYHGRVRLFLTATTTEDAPQSGHGWLPSLSRMEKIPIQGDHFTCIREDRESLVKAIHERLDQLHALVRSNRS